MATLWMVQTTLDDEDRAGVLAEEAVARGLAACAQLEGPLRSHYVWRGASHAEQEWRLTLKTTAAALAGLRAWLHEAHPYETPEWVAWEVDASEAYARWAHAQAPGPAAQRDS